MFLHSGAGLHGHEYSPRTSPAQPPPAVRRSPLLRSPFSVPSPLPNVIEAPRSAAHTPKRHSADAAALRRATPEAVVRFLEPEGKETNSEASMSEDETAHSASEASYLSDNTVARPLPRRRRAPRKSTTYLFAHPAPKVRPKKQLHIHIRPRLLLQLQQIAADKRPTPVIDVFPSSLISGNVVAPRFSKKCPRIFGVRGELGIHDVLVVRSEDYDKSHSDGDTEGEEDDLSQRDLLAVLSPVRREGRAEAEIVLEDGTVWVAVPLERGSAEFINVDVHGLTTTARWVYRNAMGGSPALSPTIPNTPGGMTMSTGAAASESKFTFSIINPERRRHPIIATLTPTTLDILDAYTTVSQSSSRYPPTKPMGRSLTARTSPIPSPAGDLSPLGYFPPDSDMPRMTLPVDEGLRSLITATSIWIAIQQGWVPTCKTHYSTEVHANGTSAVASSVGNSTSALPPVRPRANSRRSTMMSTDSSILSSAADAAARHPQLGRGSTMPIITKSRDTSPSPSLAPTGGINPLRNRATSTGAAFMQRRMQAQMSDTSDSEKPGGGRFSKGRRVLSGDFGPLKRRSQPVFARPGTPDAAGGAEDAGVRIMPGLSTAGDRTSAPPPHANEASSPPQNLRHSLHAGFKIPQHENAVFLVGTSELPGTDEPLAPKAGEKAPKWKRLSGWIRRLGGR